MTDTNITPQGDSGSPPPARRSLIGRYIHGEPVPPVWRRLFDFVIWALPIVLLGDGAVTPHGGGGSGGGEGRFDGGSCACGSEPKLCGQFPHCKWQARRVR